MAIKFYKCETCGNVVVKFADSGAALVCCGHEMKELTPQKSETMAEKHLPAVESCDGKSLVVKVGTVLHPMTPEHYIHFIVLESEKGHQVRMLTPEDHPFACFDMRHDTPLTLYEYCNLHGLWMTDIRDYHDKSVCADGGAKAHCGTEGKTSCSTESKSRCSR